ncbi:competence/damage-inducible protein A [Arenibacter sp. GZD96]|uniref:competence/damage-inducible protein A n=1 Tax=Aurantibrevibacter litoralis TaxID=3106030 RepID=UPI002AFF1B10|nr:competence/damage-inducible protein A [Arenibacter sp. GZD-96]MEA1786245.1 competence/damage-inducible protein A [Arenibacter sp. GZD-96]
MLAEIITIGDEILIGQITDTNSVFMAKELNKIGISVYQITSVQDDSAHILQAMKEAESRVDLVIMTGGLGPTKDDITKHTLCTYFGDHLIENTNVLLHVEQLFKKYIRVPISEINRKQALVPSKSIVLHNAFGTAPGMWLNGGKSVFVSLPGVPYEMEYLMREEVIPRIVRTFQRPHILHRTLVTYGMGESSIAERLVQLEEDLPAFIKLAYLPNVGKVRLRLTAKGTDLRVLTQSLEAASNTLATLVDDILYGTEDEETIEASVAKCMIGKAITLATAESCTGGKLAEMITALPGASKYFNGTVVSYATQAKVDVLQVPQKLIDQFSVVSAEVAEAMAENVKKLFKSDFAIATTGNAGPSKGDATADVGTVFIAIATPVTVFSEQFSMGNHRERVIQKTANKAFELLQKEILKF